MRYILILLITIASYSVKAQTIDSLGTTEDEYKYLTTGVKGFIDNGLDMKSGYKLTLASNTSLNFSDEDRDLKVYEFYKTQTKSVRALLLIYSKGKEQTYLCVPRKMSDDYLWDDLYTKINSLSGTQAYQTIIIGLMRYNSDKLK